MKERRVLTKDHAADGVATYAKVAEATPQTAPLKRMGLVLLALILCVGLMPRFAWAADDDGTFSVALTIVDATDGNNVICNKAVSGMSTEKTVKDMLEAAGFTEAENCAATAGSTTTYYIADQWPGFYGLDDADGNSWKNIFNGAEANEKLALGASLEEDGHYQYIYGTATTFEYGDGISDPLSDSGGNTMNANTYDEEAASTLLNNLKTRFSTGGSDASITNDTVYAALGLNMMGEGSKINDEAVLENLNGVDNPTAGVLAKYIMALTAAGVDCTHVLNDEGGTHDLIAELDTQVSKDDMDIYSAVWVLAAYLYGSYDQGDGCEMTIKDLADYILDHRNGDGLFGDSEYGYDTQTTAQAIYALYLYSADTDDSADVKDAIDKADDAVLELQNADGGFGYSADYPESSIDATANMVVALKAGGYDVTSSDGFPNADGSAPIGYLTSQADADLDGYHDNSPSNEPMTSSTVLMALAAEESNLSSDDLTANSATPASGTTSEAAGTGTGTSGTTTPAAYSGTGGTGTGSGYTPSSGTSGSSTTPHTGTTSSTTPSNTSATTPSSSGNNKLAQTGDDTTTAIALTSAIALCALAGALVARRRMRATQDTDIH